MENLKIATAQFEHKSGDKKYNLSQIEELARKASLDGAKAIAFHECSITGYTFARNLTKTQMLDLAEILPEGESITALTAIAARYDIAILAGLFEKDLADNLFKAYVCVDKTGMIAKFRKLHPFINPFLNPGDAYCIFELYGWKCGILICYDNNIIENVRATKLLGADIIFMPHVTMCTPSTRPGAGFVNPELWENRENDPTSLRLEFEGMKGRDWLMKWLPARSYDNAIYTVFSNPIGMDDDQLKNGCSMIIDPFGDILNECKTLGNDFVTAVLTPEKLTQAGGHRYLNARRPELYSQIIGKPHQSAQKVVWLDK
ncbi:nitrilase family protein [Pedobacter cryoconitis]|uniref:Putative amidohydrolase n=1 Tax=Pedobacter cryoconitis TaxID=188932 RepID=A0A7X0MKH0_9SPHI|nr:nitrilase family protein [Pedobacter cryoconitis]MBB6502189.1 putative amidohydrolase [Pedobacter cryoconitis]